MKLKMINPHEGFSLEQAKEKAVDLVNTDLKVVQGTRTNGWYFIHTDDRDYYTPFAVTCQQFIDGKLPSDVMVF